MKYEIDQSGKIEQTSRIIAQLLDCSIVERKAN